MLTSSVVSVIHLTLLPSGARPIPFAALDYEEVPAARDLECDAYGRCLEFVANARWVGFSCRQCPFNRKEFDPDVGLALDDDDDEPPRMAAVIQLR